MSREIELLTEMRDLLLVMAEPSIAKRDQRLRSALRRTVGRSKKNVAAIMLMDGTKSQAAIVKEAKVDRGNLSRLVKSLAAEALIASDQKHPKLAIAVPRNFFEGEDDSHA
jgi:hypothetical protein